MVRIKNFFKSAGRYLKSILPAFLFFTTLMFAFSAPVFATSGGFVTDKNPTSGTVYNGDYTKFYSQSKALEQFEYDGKIFMHLYEYLCAYSVLYSIPDLNSASPIVSDFLVALAHYFQCTDSLNPPLVVQPLPLSGLRLVSYDHSKDTIHNGELCNLFEHLKPVNIEGSYLCYLRNDIFYFLLEDDDIFMVTPDCMGGFLSSGDFIIASSDLKDAISNSKYTFYPTGNVGKVSWKNDAFFRGKEHNLVLNYQYFTFYAAGNLFGVQDLDHCYCVPFFTNGTDTYYGGICYYLETEIYYSGHMPRVSDIIVKTCNMLNNCVDYHDTDAYIAAFDNDNATSFRAKNSDMDDNTLTNYPYAFLHDPTWFNFQFTTLDKFDPSLPDSGIFLYCPYGFFYKFYNSTNVTQTLDYTCINSSNFGPAPDKNNCDFGFIISDTPLIMDGWGKDIETEKIPNDYYITVSGDTIYDYSITNPETGDTTTINQYITNNYNFPPKTDPDTSGDSSSSESDSTVDSGSGSGNGGGGGDVNVNVTVNNNIGGGGDGGSYDMPDTSFFDDYLDDALEESTGIRKFISDFFNSLPGQITKLICTGLVLAILCRLIGR